MKGKNVPWGLRGRTLKMNHPRPNKKVRRHSGRYTPGLTVNPKDMMAEDIPYVLAYDDWENYRDSYRDCHGDRSRILGHTFHYDEDLNKRILRDNRKHKKHNKRRKAKKIINEKR